MNDERERAGEVTFEAVAEAVGQAKRVAPKYNQKILREACIRLGASTTTVRFWVTDGVLPYTVEPGGMSFDGRPLADRRCICLDKIEDFKLTPTFIAFAQRGRKPRAIDPTPMPAAGSVAPAAGSAEEASPTDEPALSAEYYGEATEGRVYADIPGHSASRQIAMAAAARSAGLTAGTYTHDIHRGDRISAPTAEPGADEPQSTAAAPTPPSQVTSKTTPTHCDCCGAQLLPNGKCPSTDGVDDDEGIVMSACPQPPPLAPQATAATVEATPAVGSEAPAQDAKVNVIDADSELGRGYRDFHGPVGRCCKCGYLLMPDGTCSATVSDAERADLEVENCGIFVSSLSTALGRLMSHATVSRFCADLVEVHLPARFLSLFAGIHREDFGEALRMFFGRPAVARFYAMETGALEFTCPVVTSPSAPAPQETAPTPPPPALESSRNWSASTPRMPGMGKTASKSPQATAPTPPPAAAEPPPPPRDHRLLTPAGEQTIDVPPEAPAAPPSPPADAKPPASEQTIDVPPEEGSVEASADGEATPPPPDQATASTPRERPTITCDWGAVDCLGSPLRMGLVGGEPKYIYNDVARALDYANPSDVLGRLDQDDLAWSEVIDSMGRPQRMTVIGEANMWALICRSEKPGARIFFGHLCSVILPALRKTGKLPPGERLLLPGTTSVQVEEEDAELAKIDLLRDMRVREIERDKSIKALQARQGELQDGQKRIEVLIDVIADDAAAAKAAAMAAAVDAAAAKEAVRRNPPQPGEVSMGTAAQAAGWESWTKKRGRLWHSRAVGDAARSAGFVGRGLMIERDHVADDGKPYPMWYFTQIGYVAFMSEIASNRKPPAPFIIPGSTKNCPNYVYWHGVPNPTKGGAKDLPFSEDQGGDE